MTCSLVAKWMKNISEQNLHDGMFIKNVALWKHLTKTVPARNEWEFCLQNIFSNWTRCSLVRDISSFVKHVYDRQTMRLNGKYFANKIDFLRFISIKKMTLNCVFGFMTVINISNVHLSHFCEKRSSLRLIVVIPVVWWYFMKLNHNVYYFPATKR